MRYDFSLLIFFLLNTALFAENTMDHTPGNADLDKLAATVRFNIFPVAVDGRYRVINYSGEYVNEQKYDDIYAENVTAKTVIFGMRQKNWYQISNKGEETKTGFPEDFKPAFADPAVPDLVILQDISKDPSKEEDERVYDLKNKKFVTDYLSACSYDSSNICGMKITAGTPRTRAILYSKNENGEFRPTSLSYEAMYAKGDYFIALSNDQGKRRVSILDRELKTVLDSGSKYLIRNAGVSENRIVVSFPSDPENGYGFVDMHGTVKASGFQYVYPYSNGLAKVLLKDTGLLGFIDLSGKIVVDAKFQNATGFHGKVAFVFEFSEKSTCAIDMKGKKILSLGNIPNTGSLSAGVGLDVSQNAIITIEGKKIWTADSSEDFSKMLSLPIYDL